MRNLPNRPTTYRLRLPGPTSVSERVQHAITRPLVNHRGPEAHERRAKPIFGTALDNVHARHRRLAAALRAGGAALGLEVFTVADARRSDTVSVFSMPDGLDGAEIVRHMYEHHHTVIAGARNRLAGRIIRIGTMGAVGESDILTDLLHLEETLRALGRPAAKGAGVAAAAALLAEPPLNPP